MTAIRATWFTWRLHRVELALCAALLLMLGISALVAAAQLRDATTCTVGAFARAAADCDDSYTDDIRYFAADDQASLVIAILAIVPVFVGLALGVPIVARELELRTAPTAWSWSARRSRWLLLRALPMAPLLLLGIWLASLAATELARALAVPFGQGPDLDTLGNQGLPMVGRAFMAFGIGLLIGAISGRTLPAVLAGGLVMVAWFGWGAPAVRAAQYEDHYIWTTYRDRDRLGLGGLAYDDDGRDQWYELPDGGLVSTWGLIRSECGDIPDAVLRALSDEDSGWRSLVTHQQANCIGAVEVPDGLEPAVRLVPGSAFGDFERTETLVTLAIGGVAFLLTFPVVARRKPE